MNLASSRKYNHDYITRNYMGIYKVLLLLNERRNPPFLFHNLSSYEINNQFVKFDNLSQCWFYFRGIILIRASCIHSQIIILTSPWRIYLAFVYKKKNVIAHAYLRINSTIGTQYFTMS